MKKIIIATAIAFSVSACAGGYAGKNYTPVIDTRATSQQHRMSEAEVERRLQTDLEYCQSLGNQRSVLTAGAQSGAVGAVVGAGAGALGGVLAGGKAGVGSLIGAGAGALSALTYGGLQGDQAKKGIVIECLRRQGHVVVAK